MRNAINNNPMVQIGLVGVLLVVMAIILLPQFSHKSGSPAAATTTTSAQLTAPSGTVDLTVKTTQPTASGGATSGASGVAPQTGTVSPEALVPGPGLPRPVISAWRRGDAVVLLVVRNGGIDDRLVRGSVRSLSGDSGVAVFVTKAKDIARYSRITQGVGVSQVPALVIIRSRKAAGSVPQAQVSYGFRDSQTVVQAVHDALYKGKDNLPYSPR